MAALGAYAGIGRLDVGPTAEVDRASAVSLSARWSRLDAMEAKLQDALAKKPPKLPKIPKYRPVKIPKAKPPPAPRIVQVASAPVVSSSAGGGGYTEHEDEHEHEHEDEGDD